MPEIALKYLGKKNPFKFENKKTGLIVFGESPVWLPSDKAEWLMSINPKMFSKTGERGLEEPIEDAAAIIKAREKENEPDIFDTYVPEQEIIPEEKTDTANTFICPKCKREYKDKIWYDKHVSKCEG